MRFKRILLWLAAGLSALTLLVVIAVAVLPHFINTESLKTAIETRLSEELDAQVSYRSSEIFFFPHPGVTIHDGSVVFREGMSVSFESLRVLPKILPLLTGSLTVSSARLSVPEVSIRLKQRPKEKKFPTLEELRESLKSLFKTLSDKVPNLVVVVERGSLAFFEGDKAVFSFGDLDADVVFPPDGPKIRISCSSNFAKAMNVLLQLEQKSLSGTGEIDLRQFRPEILSRYFMSDGSVGVEGVLAGLNLHFRTKEMKIIDGDLSSALPSLTLKREGRQLTVHEGMLKGGFRISTNRTEVSLAELSLSDPPLAVSGNLLVDGSTGQISLNIKGGGIDLRSARKAANSIAGDVPIVQDIFSYLREGTVPHFTISSQAGSFEDLGNTENIRITGSIENGRVFIKGPGLDFSNVHADSHIVNGMLEGTDISGEVGRISINKGKIRVGLKGAVVPLRLDTDVKADLRSAQGLLKRLIKNEAIVRELSLFSNLKGNADGRVILKGMSDSPNVTADMSKITLSADYARVPYPVKITGGGIFFDGRKVVTRSLRGAIGSSFFSGLRASLDLQNSYLINISSGSLNISLPEAYQWMGSFEALRPALTGIGSVEGTVSLVGLEVNGPLLRPDELRFRIDGSAKDVSFTSSYLRGPVRVTAANIAATEKKVTVSGANVRLLDSDLVLSGGLTGYTKDNQIIDLKLNGSIGPESFRWIGDTLRFPPWVRKSMRLSVSSSHIILKKDGTTSFSGAMTVAKGPEVSLDIVSDKRGLRVNKVLIQDSSSHAEFSLSLDEHQLDVVFSGRLTGKTAGAILASDEQPGGWMSGNFMANVMLEEPMRFSAKGKMAADGFVIPWKETGPVEIDRLSIGADGDRFRVNSCDLKWADNKVSLSGQLISSEKGVSVDLDASAGTINAGSIEKKLGKMKKEEKKKGEGESSVSWLIGTLRLKADKLKYGKIEIAPFGAEMFFNGEELIVHLTEVDFCGVAFPGKVIVSHGEITFAFWPAAKNAKVESAISCFSRSFDLDDYATGVFDLSGNITGRVGGRDMIRSIGGNVDITAKDGRIYYVPSVLKILAFLEITEIVRGYSDVWRKGLAYDKVIVKSRLRHGRLDIDEGILDSPYMKMASQGYIDPAGNKLDVKVLVSPLRTIDRIIEKLPVLGWILGGTLISIPVRLSGNLENPKVSPILISSDSGLLGMMKRTLELPIKILAPSALKKKEGAE